MEVSNWLLVLPVMENRFYLTKQQFWYNKALQYSWPIANLPTICSCRFTFTIQHSMSCKKEGLINIRLSNVRDLTARHVSEVSHDVGTSGQN